MTSREALDFEVGFHHKVFSKRQQVYIQRISERINANVGFWEKKGKILNNFRKRKQIYLFCKKNIYKNCQLEFMYYTPSLQKKKRNPTKMHQANKTFLPIFGLPTNI